MNRDDDTIYAEALRWQAATDDDAMDWAGFTAWLEADPRHREAYDAVALGHALLDEHRDALRSAAPLAANDDDDAGHAGGRSRRRAMGWALTAVAASLAALLGLPQVISPPVETYATAGASRTIALDDGSSVILAPHSTLAIEGRHQERIALAGGAWFDIRHDPSRRLAVTAGGVEIADIGTRFDIQEACGQVRVAVAEGEVRVRSAALDRPIRLTEGKGLFYDGKAGSAIVQSVSPEKVGEWRSGRLSYDAMPLALVAADLSRYAGVKVTVAQGLRNRQFSGTLVIGDGEAALRDLSQVMDVELRSGPAGLVLDERR